MSKRLEDLSTDLASGMSRRKALWRFFGGVGAAVLARKASAAGNDVCVATCRLQESWYKGGAPDDFFGKCMSESAHCPKGQCAYVQVTNGGQVIATACVPAGEIGG